MLDFLLDLLFPRHCVSCGQFGQYICRQCRNKIEYFDPQVCPYCERASPYGLTHPRCAKPHGLDGLFVLAHYRGPVRSILHDIKYRGTYAVTGELAGLLISKYHHQYNFDYLVPVPLHPNRERERGFNQAEKLATALAKQMGGKLVAELLVRARETQPQFDLKYEERKTNVRDAFALAPNNSVLITNNSFCLVDDVATTGSTLFECAKALKRAKAQRVWALCIARGG